MKHWNKNHESIKRHKSQKYLTHQHCGGYTSPHVITGALIGTWHRMRDNTNSDELLIEAIKEKWEELQTIGYKKKHMYKTLKYMHVKTRSNVWALATKQFNTN